MNQLKAIAILGLLLILSSACHRNSWTETNKKQIREKIELDDLRKMFFSEEATKDYADCCMQKIVTDFEYSQVQNINLEIPNTDIEHKIISIRESCWEELLKSSPLDPNIKGVEIVTPESE
ncbi:hypothetical protein [Croceimicrobium hydrocarbonivorans]|uniref:Lipoprotein n=1 Tax=Croceimicrobium hydrocarbonivorans TaxID=2761580 RepID=A0A7H0VC55_9FLAO|nr:hypothetical protein [Croceimicrobium hydrocarbonivorans]QNR23303.1 hypothetical protein H4K34_13075 [Croceimicrobium hydrocarbonivorans]